MRERKDAMFLALDSSADDGERAGARPSGSSENEKGCISSKPDQTIKIETPTPAGTDTVGPDGMKLQPAQTEHTLCTGGAADSADETIGIPDKWKPLLDNLVKRFPDTARSDIVAAIKACDGHGGEAAHQLKQGGARDLAAAKAVLTAPEGTIELREIDSRGMGVEYQITCKACGFRERAMGGGMPVGKPVTCSSCKITAIAVH